MLMLHGRLMLLLALTAVFANCQTVMNSTQAEPPEPHNLSVRQTGESPPEFETISAALAWRDSQCILHQSSFDRSARVRDYYSGDEIDFKEAFYVTVPHFRGSADPGIVAFRERTDAERFLSENDAGEILTFDELIVQKIK